MRLPGADRAFIDPAKVRHYLLSPIHPVGRSKARFFRSLGYEYEDWRMLAEDLRRMGASGSAEPGRASAHGQKYVVRGRLRGPAGVEADVVTVWIVREGEDFPQLLTAYPG